MITAAALVRLTCAFETFEISVFRFSFLMCEERRISTVSVMRIHVLDREYIYYRFRMASRTLYSL
jgi:hypothetical protein